MIDKLFETYKQKLFQTNHFTNTQFCQSEKRRQRSRRFNLNSQIIITTFENEKDSFLCNRKNTRRKALTAWPNAGPWELPGRLRACTPAKTLPRRRVVWTQPSSTQQPAYSID